MPKVIKTEQDHKRALARVDVLFNAKPGTPEGDELELWLLLIEKYEDETFPVDLPDPIEAIRFRMEQSNLKQKDLVPLIGSKSKVSEVLAGKRDLSLTMIRKLVDELGIPADVLLRQKEIQPIAEDFLKLGKRFPLTEMFKRGWLDGAVKSLKEARDQLDDVLAKFSEPVGDPTTLEVFNRQMSRCGNAKDDAALVAWQIRVMSVAKQQAKLTYKNGTVDESFLREVVRLSFLNDGPKLVQEFLAKNGIHLVIERHLPKTYLDGAAMRLGDDGRLVAMTLRHDRMDNFWFVLLHELAHIALHIDKGVCQAVFDNLDERGTDQIEREADALASDSLIPKNVWRAAELTAKSSFGDVKSFADHHRIHPSIPAGRIRYESGNFKVFARLVGTGQVRQQFEH
ncbi:MAG TPA: hypothetical protein DDZ51_01430 [Planctomycetaceae bacterium]|nr:hypothetical protein [Planctomycetaceae bacterium]